MKEFLDEVGGKYIVQKVKQMINDVKTNSVTKDELQAKLDALDINIDLSAYATKEELTNALRNIDLSAYATKEYVTDAINNAQLSGDSSSIDLSIYAKKSDLDSKANTEHTHTMSDITDYTAPDLSSYAKKTDIPSLNDYALKTEIPSIDGLATTEYVDNAIANVPSGGNVDLSNYYTKAETYSKTEVDTAISNIEGGNTSNDSCALYDTVVANGGAVKEIIETEKPVGTNLSEIISDVANGKEIVGDGNGNLYIRMNPDKTQEELNAEFVLPNDKNGSLDFLLASSFQPEEIIIKNSEDRLKLRNRLKNGERMHYIIATNKGNNDDNYEFYYGEIFYNRISENGYSQDTCYNDMYKIFQGNVKFNLLKYMQNMKYICSGAYYNDRRSIGISNGGSYAHYNDKQDPNEWLRFKKYIPTGTEYKSPSSTTAVSENISSPEFSAHLLDTYLSNCNETLKESEIVNYTLTEWGDKLDKLKSGVDGMSPTVSITETDNGHTVSITDVNGTKSFDVTNGTNGTNGVSPIVTVTKEGKVATITCTDVNGTTTATISDGADGQGGSGGASGITYVYDTEIATGDTYFDGRPIYMRILHIDPLSSAPSSYIVYGNYKNQTPFADKVISAEPLWYTTSSTQNVFTGNIIQSFTSVSGSSGSAAVTAVNNLLKTVAWVQAWQNSSEFGITVTRGQDMYNYACDIFVKYVKSA